MSVLNPHTHEYFQLATREKPFVWKSPHGKTQRRVGCELDFSKQYRHVLMYPGMEWAVYAPTDSFSAGDPEAVWSFVDKGPPGTELREQAYRGPAFYCRLVVQYMLETKEIELHHVVRSFVPTATLKEDIFREPFQRVLSILEELKAPPELIKGCLLYTSPSPRDATLSRMPSSA